MKTATKSRVVDVDRQSGAYDMIRERAIIDHHKHGRILISEGWCGMDDIRGGAYRYTGGAVYQLNPDDTFASLADEQDATGSDHLTGIRHLLDWTGAMIDRVAKSAGL